MEDNVYIAELLDSYKALLTDKQADMLSLYYEEDLSLSEITGHYSITRQAVLDNLKRAVRQLYHYEDKLGLVKKQNRINAIIDTIEKLSEEIPDSDLAQKIISAAREMED